LNLIRRKRGQTLVVHRTTHGEVIQALPGVILQSEQCMHFIIEKTANPRGAYSGGFGFKIERLAENAALPEEVTITPWLFQSDVESRDHPQRKAGIGTDILMAADQLCHGAQIVRQQKIKWQRMRVTPSKCPLRMSCSLTRSLGNQLHAFAPAVGGGGE
jgi:hypothetical protein